MSKTPNLFDFATSELSQDAFICWLLSWAKPELVDSDKELHACATSFIRRVFELHNKKMPEVITAIDITRQDKNIDVLCVVNELHAIIIEDKTGTKEHSNQLERYLEEIAGREYTRENILPIYYKTEDQGSYRNVRYAGYEPFLRDQMLHVLYEYTGGNNIIIDYRNRLESLSNEVNSYKNTPLDNWGHCQWVGFYLELQKCLQNPDTPEDMLADWGYVANPTGGFLGFWWAWSNSGSENGYLQLEEEKLCFKIEVLDSSALSNDRKKRRTYWHKKIMERSRVVGLSGVNKPSRFGLGTHMTVCQFDGDYRICDEHKLIDMNETVARLRIAEKILTAV